MFLGYLLEYQHVDRGKRRRKAILARYRSMSLAQMANLLSLMRIFKSQPFRAGSLPRLLANSGRRQRISGPGTTCTNTAICAAVCRRSLRSTRIRYDPVDFRKSSTRALGLVLGFLLTTARTPF